VKELSGIDLENASTEDKAFYADLIAYGDTDAVKQTHNRAVDADKDPVAKAIMSMTPKTRKDVFFFFVFRMLCSGLK